MDGSILWRGAKAGFLMGHTLEFAVNETGACVRLAGIGCVMKNGCGDRPATEVAR